MRFKFVTTGQNLSDVAPYTFTFRGRSLMPLAPANLRGERSAAGDLWICWTRRSRLGAGMRPSVDVPVSEEKERYRVEIYDGATRVAVYDVFSNPAIGEPALLVGKLPGQVSGNNLLNPGAGPIAENWIAHSQQQIENAGDWIEATLKVTNATSGTLGFGFAPAVLARSNNVPGDQKHLQVTFFQLGGTTTVGFQEDGVFQHSVGVAGDPQSVRLLVEFARNEARFYVNRAGANPTPTYTSKRTLELPYRPILSADVNTQVDDVIMGLHQPSLLYRADQQTTHFGSPQSSIRVRVAQVSAIVGPGEWAEAIL